MLFPWSWSDMILCVQGPHPLLAEEKIRRLSLGALAVNLSEQVMQPLSVTPFQEESAPAFVAPTLESNPPQPRDPEEDLLCIAKTFSYLRESGWYWGSITASEAKQQLQKMPEGTFLVRDSTHPSYLFTLSVKTNRGPTNVRIEYAHSKFRLDSNCLSKPRILAFPDVVSLIQHYVLSCPVESKSDAPYPPPMPSPSIQKEIAASAVHLKLIRPHSHKKSAPNLQHLCRLQINRSTTEVDHLPLPKRMKDYLKQLHPLLAEEKIRRLLLGPLAINLSEQIMEPLSVTSNPSESAKALLNSNHFWLRGPEEDQLCIAKTLQYLQESGWYWGSMTAIEAAQLLKKLPKGKFLVRDSSHRKYLFTVSIQTNQRPTNTRIVFTNGTFKLDSNCFTKRHIPSFPDVVSLIQHYCISCPWKKKSDAPAPPPMPKLPTQQKIAAPSVEIRMILPHRRTLPTLQHCCRLQINRSTTEADRLPLPTRMKDYLKEYPFQL